MNLKLKVEEIEKEKVIAIKKLEEEQSARKEAEQKALKMERILDLMSQGKSKEEALKLTEMM